MNLYNKFSPILLLVILLSSIRLSSCNFTKDNNTLNSIQEEGVLRVGVTKNYPPYSSINYEGQYEGTDVEKAKDLARSLRVKLQLVPTSYMNLINDLRKDKFDIAMCGLDPTEERSKYGYFSHPYDAVSKVFVGRCNETERYNTSFQNIDAVDTKIMVGKYHSNHEKLKKMVTHAQIVALESTDNNILVSSLHDKKVDLLFWDESFSKMLVEENPEFCIVKNKVTDITYGFAYYMPKDIEWKSYVNKWMASQTKKAAQP